MLKYDSASGQVTLLGQPVGDPKNPDTVRTVARCLQNGMKVEQSLLRLYIVVDYDSCPLCGGPHYETASVRGVSVGYCIDCGNPTYRVKDRVYNQFGSDSGHKRGSLLTKYM